MNSEYNRQQQTDRQLPVTIISGYLGSGKTTLINGLLQQADGIRIAVLVNDFGDLAIDASLIKAQYGNVISLSGGCVCCSYGNDLTASLLDVQTMNPLPHHIVIETSGVALPGAVASSVSIMQGLSLNGVLVLANAEVLMSKLVDRYVADTVSRQLARADIIVLNQCDLASDDQLQACRSWLQKRHPKTPVFEVVNAALPINIAIGDMPISIENHPPEYSTHVLSFTSCELKSLAGVSVESLQTLLTDERYALARAKGYIMDDNGTSQLLQLVGQRLNMQVCATPPPALQNRLVCIGRMDQRMIHALQQAASELGGS